MRFFETTFVFRVGILLTACLALIVGAAPMSQAQSPFSPARQVNDRVITNYDLEQRMIFLEVLNAGAPDMRQEALDRLTEEAVQRSYARRQNIRVDRDEIAEGMAEFAARADLSADELVEALEQNGVDRKTFETFVESGLLWRRVVAREFPALVNVSDSDVARARDVISILGRQRVLISEIFLPTDPEFAEAVAEIMGMIEATSSTEEFSRLAREFSLAGTRDQGGRLPDWVPVENLPGQISESIASASPGQVIGPVELSGAIAYFQLRASDSSRDIPADRVKLTYKRLLLPGGRSAETLARAEQIRGEVRSCPELGPFARGLPESALVEREALLDDLPASDAIELARLDRNEISANTTEGDNLVVLMLCARALEFDDRPSDDRIRDNLFERRLGGMADMKLQTLIADSEIRDY